MKILTIAHEEKGGGAANSAWSLFEAYRRLGHQSYLAVGNKTSGDVNVGLIPNVKSLNQWAQFWEQVGAHSLPVPKKIRGVGRLNSYWQKLAFAISSPPTWFATQQGFENFDYPGTWKIPELFPEPFDIIHCHNLHGGYFDLGALPWLSKQAPLILNLRDAWLLSGHCAHSFDCTRWKTGCGACPDLKIPPIIKRDKTAENWKRKANIYANSRLYITAPCQWMLDKVDQSMLKGAKTKMIPNGMDLNTFCPGDSRKQREALGLPQEVKIVMFAANFTHSNIWKDYQTMKKAVELIPQYEKQLPVLFLCLGEEGESRQISKHIKIRFIPFQKEPKVLAQYYQASDVYIHAARADTFPRTVTEALACGTPVVATAVGGIPEQIENGKTGFLTPVGDATAMAEKIIDLLKHDDKRKRMGEKSAQSAKAKFSLDLQVGAFLAWYEEVIADWKNIQHPSLQKV
jgi:glycosyltransferase involved in cell wall biosynthesis